MSKANLYQRSVSKVPGNLAMPVKPINNKRRMRRYAKRLGYSEETIEAAIEQINEENRETQRRPK